MTLTEIKELKIGDLVGFAGILSTEPLRIGIYNGMLSGSDCLALVKYTKDAEVGETNHITNLIKVEYNL